MEGNKIYAEFCAIRYKYKYSIKRNAIFGKGFTQLGSGISMKDFMMQVLKFNDMFDLENL
jgi:hypothetical protein